MTTQNENDRFDEVLDQHLQEMRAEEPDAATMEAALGRVRAQITTQQRDSGADAVASAADTSLETCADFRALMPALVADTLDPSLKLLVEDHSRGCVPCRRALKAVREGRPIDVDGRDVVVAEAPRRWNAVGAIAAVFLLALAGWLAWNMLPMRQADLLQVKGIEGQLFRVADHGLETLNPGDWVNGGEEIRTAGDSGASVELADGSLVEMAARSALEVRRRSGGQRIRVNRGSIIVQAAPQGNGRLDVSTNELLATVKGTIFSVRHGAKGSRVAVIEGEVQVAQGRNRTSLYPGDQMGSRPTMVAAPWTQEIGWSENVDEYLDMLEEFQQLRADLTQVLSSSSPRYSSNLLDLVPSSTLVYIALPNPTATVAEVYQLIRQRVESSEALSTWWQDAESEGHIEQLDEFVDTIQELSSYLGEETVVALGLSADGEVDRPTVLSDVSDANGLIAGLEAELADLAMDEPELPIVLVDDPAAISSAEETLFVWVGPSVLVASTEASEIQRIAAGTSDGFAGSDFHQQIANSYEQGADYLGAVDVGTVFDFVLAEELANEDGSDDDIPAEEAIAFLGLDDLGYLVVERHQEGDRAHTAAQLTFTEERSGLAAWLASPSPMGSLDFFSADATFVSGVVTKDPLDVLDEVLDFAAQNGEDPSEGLLEFEEATGLDLRTDILATLGGEAAFGIDGPALPVPSWKAVFEVYDDGLLQASIEQLVERLNEETNEGQATLSVTSSGGQLFHELSVQTPDGAMIDGISINYAFVDGYWVLAPTRALVEQAIQFRDSGAGVTSSSDFQNLLPTDGYSDFSAVVYNRLGEAVSGLLGRLPRPEGMTEEQDARFNSLLSTMGEDTGPGLYCVYGDDDRIRLVSNSPTFLPFSGLESVIGMGALMAESGFGEDFGVLLSSDQPII